jgi:2-methylisocitrate lyase-like PEP mutase family enzyme
MTRLHSLHGRGELLVLPNAWDALSARLVEEAGARAIATSSAAVAWAHGYADGQHLPFETLVRTVASIARVVSVPITVDLERGYDDPAASVARIVEAGAEGVNLEDAAGPPERFAESVAAVRARLGGRVFLNARTCVVLRRAVTGASIVPEVLARARRYADAGADGLFVPALVEADDLAAVADGTTLPLNVMLMPGLPAPDRLRSLGVRRLSCAARVAEVAYDGARRATRALLDHGDVRALVDVEMTYAEVNALLAR